eukprot:gene23905-9472_t
MMNMSLNANLQMRNACKSVPSKMRTSSLPQRGRSPTSVCRVAYVSPPSTKTLSQTLDLADALPEIAKIDPKLLLQTIVEPVKDDVETMNSNLRNVVGNRHPMLVAAAEQIFSAGGKKLRPMVVFLVARATAQLYGLSDLTAEHRRLSEITEMIHTASLVHDDVLDECDTRRGAATINSMYGTKVAVLAGDYLFAQSSWFLANLDNLEVIKLISQVIKLISQVIADFANGEISQASSLFDTDITLKDYKDKSFYKTASLIAASSRSAAVFSGASEDVKLAMYNYGKHLGLAFQVVDDILDFTQTAEQLGKPQVVDYILEFTQIAEQVGKPQGQDLASGNLTAPVIFALQQGGPASEELLAIINSEFLEEDSLARALHLVNTTGGLETSRALAREEADIALSCLNCIPEGSAKKSLQLMVDYVLDRIY